MPNWCENSLIVSHKDAKMIDELEDAWKMGKFFQTIFPEPDYRVTPVHKTFPDLFLRDATTDEEKAKILEPTISESNWWDWRVQNWGTKWEVQSVYTGKNGALDYEEYYRNENTLYLSFDTAWNPPYGIYNALTEQGYVVEAMFYEGGCAFCGTYKDGCEDIIDILENNFFWIRKNVPSKIDAEFSISESVLHYNIEDLETDIEAMQEQLKTATGDEKIKLEQDLIILNKELNELKEYA